MRYRQGRSDTLTVGVKYCGGCRAGYDRIGIVDSLKERLTGIVKVVAYGEEDTDTILVVTGCRTACAKIEFADGRPLHYITSAEEAEQWITGIIKRSAESHSRRRYADFLAKNHLRNTVPLYRTLCIRIDKCPFSF